MSHAITLTVVTQEKELFTEVVEQVTAPTTSGEVTILPNHVPLFTQLETGELRYKKDGQPQTLVVSRGFMDVTPDNNVTVLVDSATLERDISVAQAEAAKAKAEKMMENKSNEREFAIAEASLRKALMELKIARKRSSRTSMG